MQPAESAVRRAAGKRAARGDDSAAGGGLEQLGTGSAGETALAKRLRAADGESLVAEAVVDLSSQLGRPQPVPCFACVRGHLAQATRTSLACTMCAARIDAVSEPLTLAHAEAAFGSAAAEHRFERVEQDSALKQTLTTATHVSPAAMWRSWRNGAGLHDLAVFRPSHTQ
nr:hypothetical protein HK105_006116 [Polyrhizophydium stewartii]